MAELTGFTENHVNTAIYLFIDSSGWIWSSSLFLLMF